MDGQRASLDTPLTDATIRPLAAHADETSPLIVEHRHHQGASGPTRLVFSTGDELTAYLRANVRPHDRVLVWSYDALCRDDNAMLRARRPGPDGLVGTGGAY